MLRLAMALLLAAVQAGILALALFAPRVSAEHQALYRDRSTDCRVRDATAPLPGTATIRPIDLDPDMFCRLLPRGWALEEPFGPTSRGAWSTRPDTVLRAPLRPGDRAVSLTLRGYSRQSTAAALHPFQSVTITAPGSPPLAAEIPHLGLHHVCLPVPSDATEVAITIRISAPARPALNGDGHDPRATGLELLTIRRSRATDCTARR